MNELKDTLDSGSITESKADITFKNGFSFGQGLRIALGILGFFGLMALISGGAGFIIGPIIVSISAYVLTSTYGTEISLSNNYVRAYTRSFGIKRGKWVPTVLLPDMTVLKMGKAMGMNQVFGPGEVKIESTVYEVYLLSANHRKRILLKETTDGKEAFIVAQELSEKMGKNLVAFNPVISKATRARRYERH